MNLEQSWRLDDLDRSPSMTKVIAKITKPSTARPLFQHHWHGCVARAAVVSRESTKQVCKHNRIGSVNLDPLTHVKYQVFIVAGCVHEILVNLGRRYSNPMRERGSMDS